MVSIYYTHSNAKNKNSDTFLMAPRNIIGFERCFSCDCTDQTCTRLQYDTIYTQTCRCCCSIVFTIQMGLIISIIHVQHLQWEAVLSF